MNRVAALLILTAACSSNSAVEHAGQSCAKPEDCYPNVDPTKIKGQTICLGKVAGGYCTHLCQTDADCCAADKECRTGHPQVCSPFESTGMKYCFLSCEAAVLGDAGTGDTGYCQEFANASFGCRSTGGGNENRKVCVP